VSQTFKRQPILRRRLKKALDEGYTHYTPNSGFADLREAISEKVRCDNGLDYSPDDVIVSDGGCTGSILLCMLAIVNPGDEVIISDPCFVVYEPIVRIVGATPVFVPLKENNDFRMLPNDVEKKKHERLISHRVYPPLEGGQEPGSRRSCIPWIPA
jgi:aspartate aminotransferase